MGRFSYYGERYTLYDKDVKKLQKKLEELRYELEHGLYAKENKITIDDWFHTWIKEYKVPSVKRGTIGVYEDTYSSYIKSLWVEKIKRPAAGTDSKSVQYAESRWIFPEYD